MKMRLIALALAAALMCLSAPALAGCTDNCAIHTLITSANLDAALAWESAAAEQWDAMAWETSKMYAARLYAALGDAARIHASLLKKAGAGEGGAAGEDFSSARYARCAVQAVNDIKYAAAKAFIRLSASRASAELALESLALNPEGGAEAVLLCPQCGWLSASGDAGECPVCGAAIGDFIAY